MKYLLLLFSFIGVAFIPQISYAQSDFTKTYNVTYHVNEDASTHVTFDISLTNATSDVFASSYAIEVGFTDIRNLSAKDSVGSIVPVIQKTNQGEQIQLQFNKKAVGKGKTINFQINFDTSNIAQKEGSLWEVNIPGITNKNEFTNFTVHLEVPKYFGNPIYTKPTTNSPSFTFTKDQLGTSGISLAFGTKSVYDYNLTYHIHNNGLFTKKYQIALPPDTNYQHVIIKNIFPKPDTVTTDIDGNWLAEYTLKPLQQMTVTLHGQAELHLHPQKEILTSTQIQQYTKQDANWETNDVKIQEIAKNLKSAEEIYTFVEHTLTYDFSKVSENKPHLGAAALLRNPKSADCLDFTDLFITLARAKGIPAREVDGYAYTQNPKERPLSLVKDILHAWPEYYNTKQQAWIMVDPTWGNTTGGVDYFNLFDYDHLAFVIKGQNSQLPIPAGGYKTNDTENQKDVNVTFAEDITPVKHEQQVVISYPKELQVGLPSHGKIMLQNNGNAAIIDQTIHITSNLTKEQLTVEFTKVPPFGKTEQTFWFGFTPFLTNIQSSLTIQSNGNTFIVPVSINSLTDRTKIILGGILFANICFALLIITKRARRLHVSRKK